MRGIGEYLGSSNKIRVVTGSRLFSRPALELAGTTGRTSGSSTSGRRRSGPTEWTKKSQVGGAWLCEKLTDPHQRLLRFLLVPQTHRQKVAPGAVPAGPLVKLPCSYVVRNQSDLFEIFGQRVRASLGEMPLDARFLGFDEDAQRDLP